MKSSVVIAMITGRSCGSVIVRKRCHAVAPSTAAASCSSSRIDCTPASSAIVVCGMPAQTPTRITAGSAHVKLDSQSVCRARQMQPRASSSFRIPACGWKISRHMIPMITAFIAHGHERERAREPAEAQRLGEQQREAEREHELERRHADRPDDADLEAVDEQVVVDQPAEVVEPDEVRVDVRGPPASR